VVIDISAGGAGKGMSDALAGAVDIGMVSREIAAEEVAQGAYGIAVTKDAVFGTVSASNPHLDKILSQGLTQETLAGIFLTGEITTWGQALGDPAITDEIHVYTRSDACGAAEMWAKYLGGKKQDELKGIGVNADPGVLEAVIKDPLGIGYNNLNYAYDITSGVPVVGAAVIPLDVNGNGTADADELLATNTQAVEAVSSGRYPAPPARLLYLVTRERPTGAAKDFIAWILESGQQYVTESGYIALTPEQLAESQGRLQ
jgi:phosphate transport system substrate-binding protein